MSDRLSELRRQRALIQEHLAWLDREIAASAATADLRTPPPPAPAAPVAPPSPPRPATLSTPTNVPGATAVEDIDSLLDSYRTPPASIQRDVRKGCLLYFVGGLALLGLGAVALSFLLRAP